MKIHHLLLPGLVFLLLAACAAPPPAGAIAWPSPDWPVSTPAEQGLDPAILDDMLAHVAETRLNLHSLLIIRHGAIVLEQYFGSYDRNDRHDLYSVTKSFTSTLVGIAIDQGKLAGLDRPAREYFPALVFANPSPEKDAIRLADLLTMTAGLDWVEADASYRAMYRSPDWVKWVLDLPMADPPGQAFRYCSGCSHVLSAVVTTVTGAQGTAFAKQVLFAPLGIRAFHWETTPAGVPIGGWGLSLTPRDMARLGYLYLHGGRWEDQQVVSAAWVQAATTRQVDTGGRLGYGYQWWTYPTQHGYAALGRDGQMVLVLPDLDLIVVTTAQINGHDPIFQLVDDYIIPAARD